MCQTKMSRDKILNQIYYHVIEIKYFIYKLNQLPNFVVQNRLFISEKQEWVKLEFWGNIVWIKMLFILNVETYFKGHTKVSLNH